MESLKRQALECTQLEEQVLAQTAFLMEKADADADIERWKDIAVQKIQQRAVEIDIALEQEREVVFPRLQQVCKEIVAIELFYTRHQTGQSFQQMFDRFVMSLTVKTDCNTISVLMDIVSELDISFNNNRAIINSIQFNHLTLVDKLLLDKRGNNDILQCALQASIDFNQLEILDRLLTTYEHIIELYDIDNSYKSILERACEANHLDIIKRLVKDPYYQLNRRELNVVLSNIMCRGEHDIAKAIIDNYKENIWIYNAVGLFYTSIHSNNIEILNLLLSHAPPLDNVIRNILSDVKPISDEIRSVLTSYLYRSRLT